MKKGCNWNGLDLPPPRPGFPWQMKVLVGIPALKKYNPGVEWHPGWRLFIPMTLKRGDSWKHCNSQQITIQKLSLHTWTEIFMVGDHSHLPQNTWLLKKIKVFLSCFAMQKTGMAAILLGVKFTNRGDLEGKLSSWTRYFFFAEARMGPMRITRRTLSRSDS